MKVLQINVVYNKGSTGILTKVLHEYLLEHDIDSKVIYGRGDRIADDNIIKICSESYSKLNHAISMLTGKIYDGYLVSTSRITKYIKKEKPDIVHIQCINGNFVSINRLIKWLKNNGIHTVITLHADFMFTGGCGSAKDCVQWKNVEGCGIPNCPIWKKETKSLFFDQSKYTWHKMKDAYGGFEDKLTVVSVSPWIKNRACESIILKNMQHKVILNGIDSSMFKYNVTALINEFDGKKIILHVNPNFNLDKDNIKGGYYVNEIAKKLIDKNINIVVVGPYNKNDIYENNIIFIGEVSDSKKLADYYSLADLTLLTSKQETFSMVTAESLCCGTPVVGFKAGGPEEIGITEYCRFVDYGNLDCLELEIYNVLNWKINKSIISSEASKKYSVKNMCESYVNIYKELLER